MARYWISYRIAKDRSYNERYNDFHDEIYDASIDWWDETTSFLLAECIDGVNSLTKRLADRLNLEKDLLVVRRLDGPYARYAGNVPDLDTLLRFMPYAKRVR